MGVSLRNWRAVGLASTTGGLCAAAALVVSAASLPASAGMVNNNAPVVNPTQLTESGMTLDQLIGNSFIVGDKMFTIHTFASDTFDPSQITVAPINFGLEGIGFDLLGAFNDAPGDGVSSGYTLEYWVEVLDPGFAITDNFLQFNGFAAGDGSFATVNETLFTESGEFIGNELVFADGSLDPSEWVLQNSLVFDPQISLMVVKDVQFFANGAAGIAGASFIRQTFSQIPSPAPMALFGLMGLAIVRRRRR